MLREVVNAERNDREEKVYKRLLMLCFVHFLVDDSKLIAACTHNLCLESAVLCVHIK